MTIISLLLTQAKRIPDQIAIVDKNKKTITFSDLAKQSALMANALQQRNINRGDKVLVAVWPGIDLYITLAALWRLGVTAVFPEAAMGLKGLCYAAKTIAPKAMIAATSIRAIRPFMKDLRLIKDIYPPSLRGDEEFLNDDALETDGALISFTSGTTGAPKAMERSHALLLAQHNALAEILGSNRTETDLVAFPAVALSCLGHGHTIVLPNWNLRRHDKANIETLLDYATQNKVTRLIAPPIIVENLVKQKNRLPSSSSLRTIITGGGPLYPDIMQKFEREFPNIQLVVLYGSTEAEPISHLDTNDITKEEWVRAFQGGGLPVGKPSPYANVRLGENNEIMVAGKHVNESYLDKSRNGETKCQIDGKIYHRTGDIGYFDANNQLWLLGRLGTQYNNLFPFALEIEARLQPGIKAAAAMMIDDKMVLAISGKMPSAMSDFSKNMIKRGVQLRYVKHIPKDRRHRSKVDYKSLRKILTKQK